MMLPVVLQLLFLAVLVRASNAPSYTGYTKVWQDAFSGAKGQQPSTQDWNIIQKVNNYNNELQTYTNLKNNVQFSGTGTLQLIPGRKSRAAHGWESGRIESKRTITPQRLRVTRVEASLRLPNLGKGTRQGIWPAFWMLGDSLRTSGTPWPKTGEVDIMENINGLRTGYGSLHCDKAPGGICNEPTGLSSPVNGLDGAYHVWRVEFDRRSSNWMNQKITWYLDGQRFNLVTGKMINNADVWARICASPMYIILNVAVGGDWPGNPNSKTLDGRSSMMEVAYVAHYVKR